MKVLENKIVDERLYYKRLKSGLDIYFMPKTGYVKKHAVFATNYGSNDNRFIPIGEDRAVTVPEGIAHFLEHKLFEEPDINIFDKFSKLGAYVNAYTNFNQTAYLFSSTDHFYESLELLVKFVQNPYFTDENVEKEKGIIGQEIKMYQDNPNWRVFFNCLNGMYFEHPIKNDIAGTIESINHINKEILYKAYNTFYNPSNMVLFVVGDLSFDKIVERVNKVENKNFKREANKIEGIYPDEPKEIKEKYIEEKLATSIPLFAIGFKDINLGTKAKEQIKKDLTTNILLDILFGNSSKFYNKLYEKGLIDNSFGSYFTGRADYGHSLIVGQSVSPKEVYEEVIKYIKDIKKNKLSEENFNRIKSKNIGGFLMGLNSIEFISNYFIDNYFNDFLFIDFLEILDSISLYDVETRLENHLLEENIVLSIVNPL
ncbi:MAG: insulinase family protein [Tissierellia bacterium]|nr:insulinase family protein [Tissierellia bacterium]